MNFSLKWSYISAPDPNQLSHSIYGNKQTGYRLVSWNCGRALLLGTEAESTKLTDIKQFIEKHEPHLFAVIECDLHGPNTTARNRVTTFSTQEVKDKLHIDGYSIELPDSWEEHHQARILVFISDKIKAKKKTQLASNSDLPILSFEVGLGRERKTNVNFYYRCLLYTSPSPRD